MLTHPLPIAANTCMVITNVITVAMYQLDYACNQKGIMKRERKRGGALHDHPFN